MSLPPPGKELLEPYTFLISMNLDVVVGCQASRRTIDTLTASRLRQAISNPKEKLSIIRERARERRRQIKAMLSNRPACCFCVCVCGFVVRIEKTVFKRHRRRERRKSLLHLPSARCNGFTALQRSKPREAGGCRCLQSRELRVQESFTDTIAFNQLFSGKIAGVIMELKKKKNSKGGRAGSRSDKRGKGCLSRARAAQGKAFHI